MQGYIEPQHTPVPVNIWDEHKISTCCNLDIRRRAYCPGLIVGLVIIRNLLTRSDSNLGTTHIRGLATLLFASWRRAWPAIAHLANLLLRCWGWCRGLQGGKALAWTEHNHRPFITSLHCPRTTYRDNCQSFVEKEEMNNHAIALDQNINQQRSIWRLESPPKYHKFKNGADTEKFNFFLQAWLWNWTNELKIFHSAS